MEENQINFRRKINARATALRGAGRSDDEVLDSILQFDDLPEQMSTLIKQGKASGQSKDVLDQLIEHSSQGIEIPTTTADDLQTRGFAGNIANFLGIEKAGRRLGAELAKLDPQHRRNLAQLSEEEREMIGTGGVSNREALGSAANVGLSVIAPGVASSATRAIGGRLAGSTVGRIAGSARPLIPQQLMSSNVGRVAAGAGLGYASDIASGLEQGESTAEAFTPGVGTAIGAATGFVPGVAQFTRKLTTDRNAANSLKNVLPKVSDLTPTQYDELLRQGRIKPRTATKPAEYVLSDQQIGAATRHADIIAPDPAVTTQNISQRIGQLDNEVGEFLTQNNGIFNKNQLRKAITDGMKDVSDISVPQARIDKTRGQMIDNFLDSLEQNDMHSLWQARKSFDRQIENAFSGSPSLQKEMRRAFRDSIQDYIATRTPNNTYKTYMKDMSGLFDLQDLVAQQATKQRSLSGIGQVMRDRPMLRRGLQYGGVGLGGAILGRNLFGGGGAGFNDDI